MLLEADGGELRSCVSVRRVFGFMEVPLATVAIGSDVLKPVGEGELVDHLPPLLMLTMET